MTEPNEQLSEEETARRRDEVVKRMIATPPAPHKPKAEKPASKATVASKGRPQSE